MFSLTILNKQFLFSSSSPTPVTLPKVIMALSNHWDRTIEQVTLFTYEYLQSLYLYESLLGITSCIFLVGAAVTHRRNKQQALAFAATSSQVNAYRFKLIQLTDDSVTYFAHKLSIFFIVLGGFPYFCLFLYLCGLGSFCYSTIFFIVSTTIKIIQAPYCLFFCSFATWDTFWLSWELMQITTLTNFLAYTPYGPELIIRDTYFSDGLGLYEYAAFPQTVTSQLFFLTEFSTWYHIYSFLFMGFYLFVIFKGFNSKKIFFAGYSYEFLFFLLLSVLGLNLFINSTNFFSMYVSMEFFSICLYLLIFSARYLTVSLEAGIKYLFLGAFNTTFLLLGLALIYFNLRSTSIFEVYYHLAWLYYIPKLPILGVLAGDELSDYIVTEFTAFGFLEDPILSEISITLLAGITCIILGFLFKLAIAPFHFWALDVYEGAPLAVTFFLAVFVKSTLFFYFLRLVFFVFFPLFGSFFRYLFLCVGLLSLVIGAFGGLVQKKIKRLFAYSSLTNMGFLFIILSAVEPNFLLLTVRAGGLFYVVTYALGYFLTMVIVFTILLFFFESANGLNLRYITDLQLLRYTYGKWGILLACCLFSLAGVPPFPGFFLKFYGLVNIGSSIFHYVLLGTALLTTVSTFYYMRLIKIMYFDNLNIEHLQYFDYNFSKNEIIFSGTQDSYSALINSFKNYITFERFLYSILILVFSIFTYSILLTGYWWSYFTYFCVDSFTVPFGLVEARIIEAFSFSTCSLTEKYLLDTHAIKAQHYYLIDLNTTVLETTTSFLPFSAWTSDKTYSTLLVLRALNDISLGQEFQFSSFALPDTHSIIKNLGHPLICLVPTTCDLGLEIASAYFFTDAINLPLVVATTEFQSLTVCTDIKNPIIGFYDVVLASTLCIPHKKNITRFKSTNVEYQFIFHGVKGNIFPMYFLKTLTHLHKLCQKQNYTYFNTVNYVEKVKLAYFSRFVKSIPNRSTLISVLRSPHVFKTAQEQFKLTFQKQIIFFTLFSSSNSKSKYLKQCILNLLRDLSFHFRVPIPFLVAKCVEQKLVILHF